MYLDILTRVFGYLIIIHACLELFFIAYQGTSMWPKWGHTIGWLPHALLMSLRSSDQPQEVSWKYAFKMCCAWFYYMANSVSGEDEPNRVLWLATRAGKMEPSCPLGTTHCIPQAKLLQKPYNKSFIDQVCSVKMTGYWPRSFFASLCSSLSKNTQKRTWPISSHLDLTLGQYPIRITSRWWAVLPWCDMNCKRARTLHYFSFILFIQFPKNLPWCMAHESLSSKQACEHVYQCQLHILTLMQKK